MFHSRKLLSSVAAQTMARDQPTVGLGSNCERRIVGQRLSRVVICAVHVRVFLICWSALAYPTRPAGLALTRTLYSQFSTFSLAMARLVGTWGELDDIIQALPLSTLAANEPLGPWLAHPALPNAYTRHRVWSSSSGIHDDTRQIVQHTNTRPGRLTIGRGSIRFICRAIHIVQ